MHITAVCPRCLSRYQVEPNLAGKHMRCPNAMCRAVFEVTDPAAPVRRGPERAAPEAKTPQQISGSVGDIVPILSAEPTMPEALSSPVLEQAGPKHKPELVPLVAAEAIQAPPPAVDDSPELEDEQLPPEVDEETPGVRSEPATSAFFEGIRELGPGSWQAPPVRLPTHSSAVEQREQAFAGAGLYLEPKPPTQPSARGWFRRAIIVVLLVVAGVLGGGFYLVRSRHAESEGDRFQRADKLYKDREFADAVIRLQNLVRDFPDSKNRRRYQFLAELSDVRDPVYHAQGDAQEAARTQDRLLQFLEVYKDDPLLLEHEGDVHDTLLKMARELRDAAEQKVDRGLVMRARKALDQTGQFKSAAEHKSREARRDLEAGLAKIEEAISRREQRAKVLETIQNLARKPSAGAVQEARSLARSTGLADHPDAELAKLLEQLIHGHAAGVTYTESFQASRPEGAGGERASSLFVVPALVSGGRAGADDAQGLDRGPMLALARGVLYALDPRNGQVRWARRVGADTTELPLRLPATPIAPESFLVLSADDKTLTAVAADSGTTIWQQQLSDVCLGRPVLIGRRVFVPTQSGRVEEIETTEGRLLGHYELGQPLTAGAVHQPGTALLFVPADQFTIYILDVARRSCAGVLYAGHPNGSVRTPPILIRDADGSDGPDADAGAAGWLVLCQNESSAVKLRIYRLPIAHPDQAALPLEHSTRGSCDFAPWYDGERLALATNAGVLSLLGVRQKGHRDDILFPLLKEEVVLGKRGQRDPGSALVVHADRDNFWVLARHKLHRLQTAFLRESGPDRVLPRWPEPPTLGVPLHAAQVPSPGTLFLATRAPGSPTCLATALESQQGSVHWQRQLGLVCRGQALVVGERVLVEDAAGLFVFDAGKIATAAGVAWQAGGAMVLRTGPRDSLHLVTDRKKTRALAVKESAAASGHEVQVLDVQADNVRPGSKASLPAALAGSPALAGEALILPLRDGILSRLPLGEGTATQGPHWRAPGIDEHEPAHVLAVSAEDLLATDGSRGLSLLHWSGPKTWETKASIQLPRRITAAPAVLPGPELRVAVADASEVITLLGGERLRTVRQWNVGGKITAGPLVRGDGIACVVGKQRLVWLDPERDQPLWEYTFVAPIVGEPQLVDGQIIVADLAGQFVSLDPASGRPVGPGYTLRANVAPASAPVPFGSGRLFAPLTDGTVLLLSVDTLRHPLQGFPVLP